jgi:hypothetical protein
LTQRAALKAKLCSQNFPPSDLSWFVYIVTEIFYTSTEVQTR